VDVTHDEAADNNAEDVFRLVVELSRKLMGEYEAQLERLDLTLPQAQLLRQLGEPRPMAEAAERLRCDPSNVTGIVDRLEKRGLVERKSVAEDRRVKQLELTDAGMRVRTEVERVVSAMPGLEALSTSDRDTLKDLLARSVAES